MGSQAIPSSSSSSSTTSSPSSTCSWPPSLSPFCRFRGSSFYSFQLIHSFLPFRSLFALRALFLFPLSLQYPSRPSSCFHLIAVLFLLLLVLLLVLPQRAYMYTRGINSQSPRKNRGNVITTLSFARSCLPRPASAPRTRPYLFLLLEEELCLPGPCLPTPSIRHPPPFLLGTRYSSGRSLPGNREGNE